MTQRLLYLEQALKSSQAKNVQTPIMRFLIFLLDFIFYFLFFFGFFNEIYFNSLFMTIKMPRIKPPKRIVKNRKKSDIYSTDFSNTHTSLSSSFRATPNVIAIMKKGFNLSVTPLLKYSTRTPRIYPLNCYIEQLTTSLYTSMVIDYMTASKG